MTRLQHVCNTRGLLLRQANKAELDMDAKKVEFIYNMVRIIVLAVFLVALYLAL